MFILELTLKGNPLSLSIQRKSAEEAEATYQEILGAMKSGNNPLLELTCDRQPDKKIAVFADNLAAVQVYEKSSANASGRPAGFSFAIAE